MGHLRTPLRRTETVEALHPVQRGTYRTKTGEYV